jgi:pyruvate ferredoxin oxidoreductase beta subunit
VEVPPRAGTGIAKLAVESCFWPLYEAEWSWRRLNYLPKEKKPISEWTRLQGRFRHLQRPENEPILHRLQEEVDRRWGNLLVLCGEKKEGQQ